MSLKTTTIDFLSSKRLLPQFRKTFKGLREVLVFGWNITFMAESWQQSRCKLTYINHLFEIPSKK